MVCSLSQSTHLHARIPELRNLTPNPFPSGKGSRNFLFPFPLGKGLGVRFLSLPVRFRDSDCEIANLDVAPRALREEIFDRADRRQSAKIGIPPLLESKLRRVGISRYGAALRLADRHNDVRVRWRIRLCKIAQ